MSLVCLNRRKFFKQASAAVVLGATLPFVANSAHAKLNSAGDAKHLKFYNRHTNERVDGVFFANGQFKQNTLAKFNHHFRDHRRNEQANMDPKLFEFLHKIQQRLNYTGEIHIISGYRSPKTNAMLANKSKGGVAKKSFHMQGKAIDFAMPGVDLKRISDAAKSLKLGGVGYYPVSGFVHIDTAHVRSWSGQ
ncbi:DUF882 domain-containing protein [Thalassotalea maritima]|uniref:DUF882 domain-containing protein n=1 Tax=Thalassotalea maritima TaxID=3242416 RepID=UPI003529AF17